MKPKNRPTYWRSLSELEGDPEFQQFVEREFRSPTEQTPLDGKGRRRFMQLMGASFALSGCNWRKEKILPYTRRPDELVPGVPQYYATSMDLGGAAVGLLAKSFDGRPIKIEGLPSDDTTLGGTGTYHQAAILSLYDPDRSSKVLNGKTRSDWKAFDSALLDGFATAAKKEGVGFAILSQASSSPTLARLRDELLERLPQAKWIAYEPSHTTGPSSGSDLAFGEEVMTFLHPDKADVIVSLDSDFLSSAFPGGLGNMRRVTSRRNPDQGDMSRLYSFDVALGEFSAICDHRVAIKPSQIPAIAAYIDSVVSTKRGRAGGQKAPSAAALGGEGVKKTLDVAISDLLAHPGKCLLTVGSQHGPEVHALAHRVNMVLGNVGKTMVYLKPPVTVRGGVDELADLVADMEGGKVETLLILGGNPVYDAPADMDFAAALGKVKTSFHVADYLDETGEQCSFHGPRAHFLESWCDGVAVDGTVRIAQPLIDPLLGGRNPLELIAALLGKPQSDAQALIRETYEIDDDKGWAQVVHDGMFGDGAQAYMPSLQSLSAISIPEAKGLEVVFNYDPAVFDGRFANNGWLQELPHPISKLTWGNAALVSPATAKEHGLKDGHLCKVTLDGKSIELPCLLSPGQCDGTIGLTFGYGRSLAGMVGGKTVGVKPGDEIKPVGTNTYALRTSKAPYFAAGASIALSGPRQELAITQDLWAIDAVGQHGINEREDKLVRETTITDYVAFKSGAHKGAPAADHGVDGGHGQHADHGDAEGATHGGHPHPGDIKGKVHHPPLLNLWEGPVSYDGHKWGLAVDLNKCTGCSACIVACQAENNTAVVGPEEVAKGREMSWLRVERYYKGDAPGDGETPEVRQQPVMCMHCENAPCEQVCPVGATIHSDEGLNDMVYNRCIGTRYCSNNCPYKVRRFNYRNYNLDVIGVTPYTGTDDPRAKLKSMAFNPEVTVRSRGVMEKCTFCVQRIQHTKIQAKNHNRPIKDGEIQTACEQACPAGAMVFGDLNDKTSRVRHAQHQSRAYELLQELNNKPRVNYLARVSNPHPELSTEDGHSDHH